ncbi:Hypothetical predicted protein [Podarcis lilfordi]|uniref:Uncharacterized protein n=1 Tax=Podarcis lilfordi TaxID=74358 RepID=A0AA35K4T4_9SAUR|nr:Hypothetical predicted protein [Podarcis lilfordi]
MAQAESPFPPPPSPSSGGEPGHSSPNQLRNAPKLLRAAPPSPRRRAALAFGSASRQLRQPRHGASWAPGTPGRRHRRAPAPRLPPIPAGAFAEPRRSRPRRALPSRATSPKRLPSGWRAGLTREGAERAVCASAGASRREVAFSGGAPPIPQGRSGGSGKAKRWIGLGVGVKRAPPRPRSSPADPGGEGRPALKSHDAGAPRSARCRFPARRDQEEEEDPPLPVSPPPAPPTPASSSSSSSFFSPHAGKTARDSLRLLLLEAGSFAMPLAGVRGDSSRP